MIWNMFLRLVLSLMIGVMVWGAVEYYRDRKWLMTMSDEFQAVRIAWLRFLWSVRRYHPFVRTVVRFVDWLSSRIEGGDRET